jgi:hypothetical protein
MIISSAYWQALRSKLADHRNFCYILLVEDVINGGAMRAVILRSFLFFSLLFLVSAQVFAQSAITSAGQVIVATGAVQEIKADQTTRSLQRGDHFYSGDTLVTGTNSTAQIRFTDGSVVALNPNSKLQVNDYSYQKDPKNDRSVMTLVQGGFRALTGLISKTNPDAYKVQTPVAVIGVRGTNYGLVYQGQLYAGVWKGGIYLKNDKGLIRLGQGEDYNFALVSSKNVAPQGLLNPPRQLIGQCGIS